MHRLNKITIKELSEAPFFALPNEVFDKVIDLYVNSCSYDDSNNLASIIRNYSFTLSYDQIKRIIKGYGENSQIYSSHSASGLLDSLRSNDNVDIEDFNLRLREAKSNH